MNKYYYIQLRCTTRRGSMYRNCNVTMGVTDRNKFMWLHHKAIIIFLTFRRNQSNVQFSKMIIYRSN